MTCYCDGKPGVGVDQLGLSHVSGSNNKQLGLQATADQLVVMHPLSGQISFMLNLILENNRIFSTTVVSIIICIEYAFTRLADSWEVIVENN